MISLKDKKWVYWLDLTKPDPDNKEGETRCYRVSIVVENDPGHYPTGGEDKLPWYWDEDTCKEKNKELGFNPLEAYDIVSSSMAAQHRQQGRKSFR